MFVKGKAYYLAKSEEERRRSLLDLANIRKERRRRNFAAVNQGFKLASNLWKAYSDKKSLYDYAESKGLESVNTGIGKWFSEPKFKLGKDVLGKREFMDQSVTGSNELYDKIKDLTLGTQEVMTMKAYDAYSSSGSMMSLIGGLK